MLLLFGLLMSASAADPHLWLEDVDGTEALDWVRTQNAESVQVLGADGAFDQLRSRILSILDSDERIAQLQKRGPHWDNFWRDAKNPRGLWRTTTLESYRSGQPEWDVLLDLDVLAEREGENWVWAGVQTLPPDHRRSLVELSRGGADATVVREFDRETRSFVEGGFSLPEAKVQISWIDADRVFVSTDFGEGSLTDSGYPRIVKIWTRGTPLEQAETVYEAQQTDVAVSAWRDHTPGFERDFVHRMIAFYNDELFERTASGELLRVEKPQDANASVHRDILLLELRSPWTLNGQTHPAGALLAAPYSRWMAGDRSVEVLFSPTERTSLSGYVFTRNHLVLQILEDVRTRIEVLTPSPEGWSRRPLPVASELDQVHIWAVDAYESDAYWMTVTGYLTPSSLHLGEIDGGPPEKLASLPAFFDATGLRVSQHMATSADGTKVPYFQVSRADLPLNGEHPTLLYGYGGFEVSMLPWYSAGVGAGWLEKGGVYVVANIRGGGEYGPRWHQAALRDRRHRAYEDFVAVADDLVRRGVTRRERLGIQGGSNGGLLMGNMYTLYPDRFGAVVCQVPLLDMKRYHKLLAGASWMGEYGNPDLPEDWAYLKTYSPYHNIQPQADYPPILFTTSTRDDRVHPGHARKMAAALKAAGKDVLYFENIEGGHGGAADNAQAAFMSALAYTFLWDQLAGPKK